MQHSAHSDSARPLSRDEIIRAAERVCRIDAGAWTPVEVNIDSIWHLDMHGWLKANCCDSNAWKYTYTYEVMFFMHPIDATAFKIKFSDVCR